MHIRTTMDPISLHDVPNPDEHPCVYDGDGDDGVEIYFENEDHRQQYLHLGEDHRIVLKGDDSEDYVAEG